MATFKKNGEWWIDYYVNGRRKREKIGPSKKLAQDVLRKRKVQIAENRFLDVKRDQKIRFEDFAKDFLSNYSKPNKRSWWRDEGIVKILSKLYGGKYLHEIDIESIEEYKASRAKVVKPATVNKELACLKCMLNRAVDWGKLDANPASRVKLMKENNKRLRYLEKEEIKRLLGHCSSPKIRSIVVLALNTGMRKGEIENLKWRDIDFQNGCICITEQKNGEKDYLPLNEPARQALIAVPKHPSSPYVFCKKDGSTYNVRKSFATALKKAGILDFHFHDLRHTFASHLAMSGVDLNTVRELMRHKDFHTTLRYAHLSRDHKARAVNVLANQMDTIWTPKRYDDFIPSEAVSLTSMISYS